MDRPAGEAGKRAGERERPQPLPVDVDPRSLRGERVLARRAQLPAERRQLVAEGDAGTAIAPTVACHRSVVCGTVESVSGPGPIFSQFPRMFCVISSTAKVAIPAARPESRIRGIPTRNAKIPPAAAAITSDQKFPTECSRISG